MFEVRDLWPELPKAMGVITNPIILSLMSWLEWCAYNFADRCIGLAPGIVEGIKEKKRMSAKVEMIPNGCDLRLFCNRPSTDGWRPSGVSDNDFMAVFTGAHGIANGLDAVLDAAAVLKNRNRNDIKIVFVGDGKLKPELMTRATETGLDNCIFIDPVPKKKLAGLLARTDIGLMILANVPAFYYGTSPNKFFDYISAGLPVINNYPGWLADMIQEHECGVAVRPEDPKDFANALIRCAENKQLMNTMGENARGLAVSIFDRQMLANRFVDVLESVVGKHEAIV